jgi:hypothetical protein
VRSDRQAARGGGILVYVACFAKFLHQGVRSRFRAVDLVGAPMVLAADGGSYAFLSAVAGACALASAGAILRVRQVR